MAVQRTWIYDERHLILAYPMSKQGGHELSSIIGEHGRSAKIMRSPTAFLKSAILSSLSSLASRGPYCHVSPPRGGRLN